MRVRTFVATGWLNVALQAALLGLLFGIGRSTSLGGSDLARELALLALVGVPSALWTLFFYLQDRRHPEPSRYVLAAFVAGMAAASVFALPIERDVFHTSTWLYRSTAALMLGATLIRGTHTARCAGPSAGERLDDEIALLQDVAPELVGRRPREGRLLPPLPPALASEG